MRTWLLPTSRRLGQLSTVILWLAGIGLVAMTAIVAYQVFMRFVINASPAWTESGSIMLMTWFIFLGAAVGVRENFHMGFDVLLYVLPPAPSHGCGRSAICAFWPSHWAWWFMAANWRCAIGRPAFPCSACLPPSPTSPSFCLAR